MKIRVRDELQQTMTKTNFLSAKKHEGQKRGSEKNGRDMREK